MTSQTLTPRPILSFVTEMHDSIYYCSQKNLWNIQIQLNTKNSYAWYNYYYATRNWMKTNYKNDPRPYLEKMKTLRQIIDSMKQLVPESFEYNLVEWMQSAYIPEKEKFIIKAYELGPYRPELTVHIMTYAEIIRDKKLKEKYAKLFLESDYSSSGLLNYNYNILNSLDKNAILITEGDNDTYPIWMLQSIGIRKDVQVINVNLIQVDKYRRKIFEELKIESMNDSFNTNSKFTLQNAQIIIQHISKNLKNRKLYAPVAMPPVNLDSIKNQLNLTGLTYEINTISLNSNSIIRKNYEQVYKLDYLETNFKKDISRSHVNHLNQNYIVSMITLYKDYIISNELQKADRLKNYILILAENSSEKDTILKQLEIK